ncbi:tripartite tricarboxylate transporter permease [Desulfovibrio sp. OttesenSCG-928-O18]|nr:tripartite tricarboxylate transporter permease [Desulfovibrio sp. OttesenSCG-928-O18]
MLPHILEASAVIFSPFTFCSILGGVLLGILFGIVPGLTATLAVILLIPITYGLDAISGIAVLIGVYIGGISGGLVSATLIGMPGTPSSITTTFDGFPLTKKGEASKALKIGISANLVGTVSGWLFLISVAPQLARIALQFGPIEYVAVIFFGLTTVVSLSGDSVAKGVIVTLLGLVLCTIGTEPVLGTPRNTYGFESLNGGMTPIAAMIGLFVLGEVFRSLESKDPDLKAKDVSFKSGGSFSLSEIKASIPNFIRSGLIGVGIGILPGIGGSLANFVAYDQAKKASNEPETFGTGNIQGIIASETANNAVIGGALIPMMALGIPGDVVSAALMGGLQLHGLEPGPMLFTENPVFIWGIYISFLLSAFLMFAAMMLAGTRVLPFILLIPKKYLLPVVVLASIVGCYNLNYSTTDMWVTLGFGILGYFLSKYKFPLAPLVISLVLGSMFEKQLRLALMDGKGDLFGPLFGSPIATGFILLGALSIGYSMYKTRKAKNAAKAAS